MTQLQDIKRQLTHSWLVTDQKYSRIIAWLLLILGGIGWFGGAALMFTNGSIVTNTTELPLGDLNGIAVDSLGRVYCGLGFYSRVQQYGSDGKFLRSWSIDAGGGLFRMRINKKDELEVVTARTRALFRYNATGVLLEEQRSTDIQNKRFDTFDNQYRVEVADGVVYATNRLLLFPTIVKETKNGHLSTLVTVPIHRWLLMAPFPAWLFWMIAILLLQWKERQKKAMKLRQADQHTTVV